MTRKMKGSGVEWIGEIPEKWNLNKIGSIYKCRNQKVSDKEYEPLSVTKKGIVHQLENAAKSNNGDNRKLVRKDDFVINSRSDRRGSCGISKYDGSVSLINTVLNPRKEMNNLYYNYVFKTEEFADEFYRWGNGIVNDLWSTKWSNMKRIYIPYPNYNNQTIIANYLDTKCTKIDQTIEKQKQVIEKLKEYKQSIITEAVTKGLNPNVKMKDSGVEWIGKIPEHWQAIKLKNIGHCFGGVTYSPGNICDEEKGKLVLRSSNVKNGKLDLENNVYINKDISEKYLVKTGDILVCSRNGSRNLIGKNALIDKDYNYTFGAFMTIVRTKFYKYIYYFLNSYVFKAQSSLFLTSTINQLTIGVFNNMKLVLPSKNEQQQIANYLDKKCSSIEKATSKKQQLIDKLTQYKKSLIYECVTGKKEVNNCG